MSNEKIKPILHYDFEHFTEDGKVQDMSGNGYHGTINGATRYEDQWGRPNAALDFDGVNDFVTTPNNSVISFGESDSRTIITCFKAPVQDGNPRRLFEKNREYYAPANSSGTGIDFRIYDGSTTGQCSIDGIFDNNVHILAIVVNRNNQEILGYVDGICVASDGDISDVGDTSYTSSLYIGGINSTDRFCDCILYDFRIYDQVLTPTQMKKISYDMMRKVGRN